MYISQEFVIEYLIVRSDLFYICDLATVNTTGTTYTCMTSRVLTTHAMISQLFYMHFLFKSLYCSN